MEIVPGLHQVDGLPGVVNVFLWERPDGGLTLIDAGIQRFHSAILNFVSTFENQRLDRIIVTHADVDHVGGLAAVKAATGAQVICHAVEKAYMEGSARRMPRRSPLGFLYLPLYLLATSTFLRIEPVTPDQLVLDKEFLIEGLQVIHVPGHTPGQIALYEPQRGILVAADALANRGNKLSGPTPMFTPQPVVAMDSIRKLAALPNLQVVVFGHGPAITRDASDRLRAFSATL